MANISTFIYCESTMVENVVQGQSGKIHIIGPMQVMLPMFIPGMFSFGVMFGILDFNTNEPHKVRYTFKNPVEGKPLVIDTKEIAIPVQPQDPKIPEDMRGMMLNLDFRNAVIVDEGVYLSEIYFDGDKIGSYPIRVRHTING